MEIRIEEVGLKEYQESIETAFDKGAEIEYVGRCPEYTPKEWTINPTPMFDWDSYNYRVRARKWKHQ